MNKIAVVVLTRGYQDRKRYDTLIQRNVELQKHKNDHADYIIFHEGNIDEEDQQYIHSKTELLNFKFINVSECFRRDAVKFYGPTKNFGLGYRNMCNFWFCGFWKYVENYDKILRIDEDCILHCDHSQIFDMINENVVACYGRWDVDYSFVTEGLNNFTLKFLRDNNIAAQKRGPSGPYTNVYALNIKVLKDNKLLKEYIRKVSDSNHIYVRRWGDLPLWGEVLTYLYDKSQHVRSREIKYYHGSHKAEIN